MTSSPLCPAPTLHLHVLLVHVEEQGDVLLGVGRVALPDTQVIKFLTIYILMRDSIWDGKLKTYEQSVWFPCCLPISIDPIIGLKLMRSEGIRLKHRRTSGNWMEIKIPQSCQVMNRNRYLYTREDYPEARRLELTKLDTEFSAVDLRVDLLLAW